VPPTVVLDRSLLEPPGELLAIGMPIIIKPTARDHTWVEAVGSSTKALRIESKEELLEFWPRLSGLSKPAVAQQSIPGPETAVVSYHVYVDDKGEVAGEFTGCKIRTIPAEYGHTSSLTITDDPEVARLGREVCRALDLRGVAKLDVKYAPDGRLHLFEINARLTLWAHPGARAGVNLPALVYADLVGTPRPQPCRVRTCLDWAHPKDALAARAHGISMRGVAELAVAPGHGQGRLALERPGAVAGHARGPGQEQGLGLVGRGPRLTHAHRPAERRPREPLRAAVGDQPPPCGGGRRLGLRG
jgi:D-aspartate ligase